jgi:surfactin synthase thioesterase subunit
MTLAVATSRWLPFTASTPRPDALRLYCLPHAGSSASIYRPWIGKLGAVEVCPVQPPGRETRLRDAAYTRMEPLVEDLAGAILADAGNGPYAVYGHSLGGLVGYELMHEIRRRGGELPVHYFVSGCAAPPLATETEEVRGAELTDQSIVALLRSLGGTPELFLSDPTVLRMILPPVRADLTIKNAYQHRPRPPLAVPITALPATNDPRASVESVAQWAAQTTKGFRWHLYAGGHFAVLEQQAATLRHIAHALRP